MATTDETSKSEIGFLEKWRREPEIPLIRTLKTDNIRNTIYTLREYLKEENNSRAKLGLPKRYIEGINTYPEMECFNKEYENSFEITPIKPYIMRQELLKPSSAIKKYIEYGIIKYIKYEIIKFVPLEEQLSSNPLYQYCINSKKAD